MRSLVSIVAAGLLLAACSRPAELPRLVPAPAFSLIDQLERPVTSDNLRGTVVLADFVFTNCTDICPVLSFRMQTIQDRLRNEGLLGSRVQMLSFSVDPERDTPPVLQSYADRHQADPSAWRFLTGRQEEVIPMIVQGFYLGTQVLPPRPIADDSSHAGHDAAEPTATYDVLHRGRFVLIDREWQIRAYYEGMEVQVEQVVADIRELSR